MLSKMNLSLVESIIILLIIFYSSLAISQHVDAKKDKYLMTEDQKLQIVVHIWGEINRPGQYIVPDGTDVRELISIAGGPNEFSNYKNIKLTREFVNSLKEQNKISNDNKLITKKIITIDLQKYLENELSEPIPILQPGDIIKINRNNWSKWQTFIRVVSQLAIVVQAIYFYSRIE